ncbi:DNA-processing protein DprA [Helicobacter cetorum]|uniref:DNA-processing protein DprA n=1 Tax=Helicobacter cetorum TaxID=138563 RepID=UPI000CF1ABEB|nr:DNA-processing protein DprA [Helicobacter cetorum]
MKSGFQYHVLESIPKVFDVLKDPPKKLYFVGNTELLSTPLKVAIIGTRRPNPYSKQHTITLARELSKSGVIIVSGGALGVDIIAQENALPNTIMLSPCSLDLIYPTSNAKIIQKIAKNGLILSEYEKDFMPFKGSFLARNRLVIALSDIVIIPQADLLSGSMSSARLAQKYQKPLFVLPQRLNESEGTNELLEKNQAKGIYNIQNFINTLLKDYHLKEIDEVKDEFLEYCAKNPSYEEAYLRYGDKLLEYELLGKIKRINHSVVLA